MAPNGDESAVRRLAKASLLKWEPLDNPGVIKQLRHGERYFLTTRGMCDCGTEIGVSVRTAGTLPPRDADISREVKKLKKKGWTDAKVDRWIEQTKAEIPSDRECPWGSTRVSLSSGSGPYPDRECPHHSITQSTDHLRMVSVPCAARNMSVPGVPDLISHARKESF